MWHTKEHVGDPEEKCQSQERHLAKVLCTRAFLEAGSPGQRKTLSEGERRAAFMFLIKAQRRCARVLCLRGKEEELLFFPRGWQRTLKTLFGLKSVFRGEEDELLLGTENALQRLNSWFVLHRRRQLHSFNGGLFPWVWNAFFGGEACCLLFPPLPVLKNGSFWLFLDHLHCVVVLWCTGRGCGSHLQVFRVQVQQTNVLLNFLCCFCALSICFLFNFSFKNFEQKNLKNPFRR